MLKPKDLVEQVSAFIFDMDGVLYVGKKPIPGASRTIEHLRRKGKKLMFVTNKSTSTRRMYALLLRRMGIKARESEIITSAYATTLYLKRASPGAKVYVIGEKGLKLELKRGGFKVLPEAEAEQADYVVVGMDRTINYRKLTAALRALLKGAEFIATNPDQTYPTEHGICPGAGAMIGALKGSAGRGPKAIIGKPSPHMLRISLALLKTKPSETAIVGDKLDTDVLAGKRAGVKTVLVLTGVTSKAEAQQAKGTKLEPDLVIENLMDLAVN